MASSDEGLDRSLPWGRRPPAEGLPPVDDTAPADSRPRTEQGRRSPQRAEGARSAPEVADGPRRQAAEGPGGKGGPGERFDRLEAWMAARLDRLEKQVGTHNAGLEARLEHLEEQVRTHGSGLEARLEELERRLDAARTASTEAVGMLAGHVVARFEEQAAALEAVVQTDHQEALAAIDAAHRATIAAIGGLASRHLVDRLLEGIVATGEALDAEVVDLRRAVKEQGRSSSGPAPREG